MTEKQMKRKTQQLVETKIKNYIVGDLEELGRRFFNEETKVSLKWSLISCEIWMKVGNNKPKLAGLLFSNNWYKIEYGFRQHPGFTNMLKLEFDAYNFVPIDYRELGRLRALRK